MGAHISVPMYQRTVPQRYRLVANACTQCGAISFPPKATCPQCSVGREFTPVELKGTGVVYTYTVIAGGGAPPEFTAQARSRGRYPVVMVALDEGPKVVGQLVDCDPEDIRIGMRVRAVMRRIYVEEEVIRYGFKFRPA